MHGVRVCDTHAASHAAMRTQACCSVLPAQARLQTSHMRRSIPHHVISQWSNHIKLYGSDCGQHARANGYARGLLAHAGFFRRLQANH